MISLAWNTRGRLGRRAYQEATGRMSFVTFAAIVVTLLVIFNFTRNHTYITGAVAAVVMAILLYIQYCFAQLAIRRLHDRGLPGILYFPIMAFSLVVLYYAGYSVVKILYAGGFWSLIYNLPGLMEPYIQVFFYKGIGFSLAVILLMYNIFVNWNLGAEGRSSDNRYGPAPE